MATWRQHMRAAGERVIRPSTLCGLLGVVLIIFALRPHVGPLLQNGDAAVYNDQVDQRDLGIRTVHIGYILLGTLFRTLLPGPTDLVMNQMSVVLGAIGILSSYLIALRITGSIGASGLAAAGLLVIPAYLRGMLLSEVDVPLAAASAVAYGLLLYEHPLAAGLAYASALLISPLAALSLPALLLVPVLGSPARSRWSVWRGRTLLFLVVSLVGYLPVVYFNRQDYLWGGRGIFHAPREAFDLATQARRSLKFASSELEPMLAVNLAGALAALLGARWREFGPMLLGVVLASGATLVFGERFKDVPAQLPNAVLMAPWTALLLVAPRPRAWLKPVLRGALRLSIAVTCLVLILSRGSEAWARVRGERDRLARERDSVIELQRSAGYPLMVVGARGFTRARRLSRVAFGNAYDERAKSAHEFRRQCQALAQSAREYAVWFVHGSNPSACSALEARYKSTTLTAGGSRFRLLIPRE